MNNDSIANYTLSLSQAVVKLIEDKILSGEYVTGDKINEYAIASELNISRAPIREATRELQTAGLIEYLPRKSGIVAKMTREDTDEIFDIRISLEKDIIKLVIEKNLLTDHHIKMLKEKAQHMYDQAGQNLGDKKIYMLNQLDLDFHSYLWQIANSPRRYKMLRNMFMQLVTVLNDNTQSLGNMKEKAQEHFQYIDYLAQGNIAKAQEALESHINTYKKELYTKIYNL